jgi:hypothetical protein
MAKKGGGLLEGLWVGTGLFAASNASTYVGFLGNFFMYALFLVVVSAIAVWVMSAVGREGFEQFSYPPCPKIINAPTGDGDKKCVTASGDVRIY